MMSQIGGGEDSFFSGFPKSYYVAKYFYYWGFDFKGNGTCSLFLIHKAEYFIKVGINLSIFLLFSSWADFSIADLNHVSFMKRM